MTDMHASIPGISNPKSESQSVNHAERSSRLRNPKLIAAMAVLSAVCMPGLLSAAKQTPTETANEIPSKNPSLTLERFIQGANKTTKTIEVLQEVQGVLEDLDMYSTALANSLATLTHSPEELKSLTGIYDKNIEALREMRSLLKEVTRASANTEISTNAFQDLRNLFSADSLQQQEAMRAAIQVREYFAESLLAVDLRKDTLQILEERVRKIDQQRLQALLFIKNSLDNRDGLSIGSIVYLRAWEDLEFVLQPNISDLRSEIKEAQKAFDKESQTLAVGATNIQLLIEAGQDHAHKHSTVFNDASPTTPPSLWRSKIPLTPLPPPAENAPVPARSRNTNRTTHDERSTEKAHAAISQSQALDADGWLTDALESLERQGQATLREVLKSAHETQSDLSLTTKRNTEKDKEKKEKTKEKPQEPSQISSNSKATNEAAPTLQRTQKRAALKSPKAKIMHDGNHGISDAAFLKGLSELLNAIPEIRGSRFDFKSPQDLQRWRHEPEPEPIRPP
jgi:hypothetical protein